TDGQKMVAMSENDSIPSLENLVNDNASWLYFSPWYMNYLTSEQNNPVENLIEIYQSDYCITLDELPDLKSYPINQDGGESSENPTKNPTEKPSESDVTLWGDANCDGAVTVADATLILQVLGNGDKYVLSEQGRINADVYDTGDGLSAKDALTVQRYDAKQIEKLPVKSETDL
ncbi:MAG: dockerin type I repeat-containing protein, partial [Ruminococcus sp.]|nr:dockerin type I repeat-containing protein [Ruminococcus sp.]